LYSWGPMLRGIVMVVKSTIWTKMCNGKLNLIESCFCLSKETTFCAVQYGCVLSSAWWSGSTRGRHLGFSHRSDRSTHYVKMDPKNAKDFAERLKKTGRGAGLGGGALALVAAVGYAASKSFYTGNPNCQNAEVKSSNLRNNWERVPCHSLCQCCQL